jgi:hypothetical protein
MEMQDQEIDQNQIFGASEELKNENRNNDIENILMEDDDGQNVYRMVNKEYYCYVCALKLKKLIGVQDLIDNGGFTCDRCQ